MKLPLTSAYFNKIAKYFKNHPKISLLILFVIALSVFGLIRLSTKPDVAVQAIAQAEAVRGSIEVTVTGTGTITPVESEELGLDVSGTVNKIYVKNGEQVKKGDLLFELVNESLALELEKAMLNVEKERLSLENSMEELAEDTITAPIAGRVVELDVDTGDEVSNNAVLAVIQDDTCLEFDMPVTADTANKVNINQNVEVFLPDRGDTITGKVVSKNSQSVEGYNRVYLKVSVAASGDLSADMKAFGTVTVDGKKVDALAVSSLKWVGYEEVKSTLNGKVDEIYIQEGQLIRKGQKLFSLSSESNKNQQHTQNLSYQQALLDLADLKQQMDELLVKAPIDGYITGMDVRVGDKIENGSTKSSGESSSSSDSLTSSPKSLGKVVNFDKMVVSFPVDEVDINKVKVGQKAEVTVDAIPDRVFSGKVTEISEEGEVTNNVSSFNVQISLENSQKLLKSGMTANITILVNQKDDAVLIPIEALQEKGQRKFVMVPGTKESGQNQIMKPVTTGLINESYVEILEGLKEGEKVLLSGQQTNIQNSRSMMPGMGGPMGGGGRIPGGRSSGGGR